MHTIYVGVGSNIDAEANIIRALDLLLGRLSVTAVSPFYRSQAAGGKHRPDFTNGAFAAETDLSPRALKYELLRGIEDALGRRRTADKNASRPIDLDLVLYEALIIDEPGLTVPDPGLRRYPFVALPLLALAPDIVLPDSGKRLKNVFPGRPEDYRLEFMPELSAELHARLDGAARS
ncbi:MAG: 2-amino-4-hydroxy-6-hydroxymethyldihydropteridine diphosphokinase [Spirochaetales bacterium]|nr:2-amino-4-hydroxy-6-hydroxymethyldihydropteridine diphosphokinase [Spirochaetales bacterium]